MTQMVLISLLLLAGYGFRRLSAFPEETAKVLNQFVIHVSLPALVLARMPEMQWSGNVWIAMIMPWIMLSLAVVLVWSVGQLMAWDRPTRASLYLLVALGNTSFLGIPMVQVWFDEAGVPYALLYDQLGSFLALSTYGVFIVAWFSGSERPTLSGVAYRVATFPPFIALVAAALVSLSGWSYPPAVSEILERLADTLVPVVMVAVGFQFRLVLPRSSFSPVALGLLIKMVIMPVAALLLCMLLGQEALAARVAIFEAGMPPMITAGALAIAAGFAPERSASMVGLGILLSFVTLPAVHALLRFL
ncbi:MAG: AEC family transporter [Magnetococcales bacterium]|nr:AEC family transporter [Magnetococcales bacterium]